MKKQNMQNGFTLIEILVAMTIFAIAVSTLFGSFNIIISNINPINAGLNNYEMAQTAMDRIKRDLLSLCLTHYPIYIPPDMEGDDSDSRDQFRLTAERTSINGNSFSNLRFASFDHIAFNLNEQCRIGIIKYYVEALENGTFILKRSDIGLVFYDESKEYKTCNAPVLCEKVKRFDLIFVDQDGKPHENWNSDSSDFGFASPYAINIKLEIGNQERSDIFATTIILPSQRDKIGD